MEQVIRKILNDNKIVYKKVERAKSGFTSLVYFVDDKFVVKISNEPNYNKLKKEIDIYKNLHLEFMAKYISSGEIDGNLYLIISKLTGKSLYSIWHTLTVFERQNCVKQIAQILKEFNSQEYNFLSNEHKHLDWGEYFSGTLKEKSKQLLKMGFDSKIIDIFVLEKFPDLFSKNVFGLIFNDAHFDNFIYDDGKLYLIDFDRAMVCPIDYEMLIFKSMCDNPIKFASEEDEPNVSKKDYLKLYEQFRVEYPEMFEDANVDKRIALYQFNYFMKHAINCEDREIVQSLLNDFEKLASENN